MTKVRFRREVLARAGYACEHCGMTDEYHKQVYDRGLIAHHIVPVRYGGENDMENGEAVCFGCHPDGCRPRSGELSRRMAHYDSEEGIALLKRLAEHRGEKMATTLRALVAEAAKREGVAP